VDGVSAKEIYKLLILNNIIWC